MKFFIDTANLEQIREAQAMGVLDGVTTNPFLLLYLEAAAEVNKLMVSNSRGLFAVCRVFQLPHVQALQSHAFHF